MTSSVKQAKEDLLNLGIELDDRLIERLQKNLGVEKIFQVAHDVSQIIKSKPKAPSQSNQDVVFRYVSPDADSNNNKHVFHSVNPFQKELFQLDSKYSISILRKLEDRSIEIEPQHRPHIERMLDSFQLQYSRSPERFIGRLLGKKWTTAERKDADLIARTILQNRLVTSEDFKAMVKRVYAKAFNNNPSAGEAVLDSFFKVLAEDQQFSPTRNREMVDLWKFITLIKAATEESRRSYDGKTSQLATDVEFWRKSNNVIVPSTAESSTTSKSSSSISTRPQSAPRQSGTHPRRVSVNAKSVAELLGQTDYAHKAQQENGRRIKGCFSSEIARPSSVQAALGCDRPPSPPSPLRDQNWWKKESKIPLPPSDNALDSSKIAYLLGNSQARPSDRGRSAGRVGLREYSDRANTSVGQLLRSDVGSSAVDAVRTSSSFIGSPKRETMASSGQKIGSRQCGVDPSSQHFRENIDYIFDKSVHARAHDRRMKIRSPDQLHWKDKPSVAAALHPENLNY
eukprot:gene4982-5470_t